MVFPGRAWRVGRDAWCSMAWMRWKGHFCGASNETCLSRYVQQAHTTCIKYCRLANQQGQPIMRLAQQQPTHSRRNQQSCEGPTGGRRRSCCHGCGDHSRRCPGSRSRRTCVVMGNCWHHMVRGADAWGPALTKERGVGAGTQCHPHMLWHLGWLASALAPERVWPFWLLGTPPVMAPLQVAELPAIHPDVCWVLNRGNGT